MYWFIAIPIICLCLVAAIPLIRGKQEDLPAIVEALARWFGRGKPLVPHYQDRGHGGKSRRATDSQQACP
jgi:hypothetical protein